MACAETKHYLTIHFAPMTACICVEIDEHKARNLRDALDEHTGKITMEVSTTTKTTVRERSHD